MNVATIPSLDRAPVLTMPATEAAFLRAGYAAASVILEYGSGGSTAMAAEMPGKTVWSVESDKRWMLGLQDWFSRNAPVAELHLRHANIGPLPSGGFQKTTASGRAITAIRWMSGRMTDSCPPTRC